MDSIIDIIITIAILGVGGLLTGGKKNGKKAAPAKPARERRPVWDGWFQTEPAAEARPMSELLDDDAAPAPKAKKKHKEPKTERGAMGKSYFTYEDSSLQDNNAEVAFTAPADNERTSLMPSILGEPFDLRKAFIYQTVMERVEY